VDGWWRNRDRGPLHDDLSPGSRRAQAEIGDQEDAARRVTTKRDTTGDAASQLSKVKDPYKGGTGAISIGVTMIAVGAKKAWDAWKRRRQEGS